ncbi:hypothetical protein MBLNU459_g4753t1 [Dothideomycetes sp. NU459]
MPLPSASFVLSVALLAYLSTFVLFALLRIITGISIQRVGYSGFRRIAFSPRDGIKILVRGVGLSVHRPTFAQPTWVSLTITEPQIIIDIPAFDESQRKSRCDSVQATTEPDTSRESTDSHGGKWKKLTDAKEKIKRLHRKVKWLQLVDVVVTGANLVVQDVGALRIERLFVAVDTRAKTVDRSRLFQHHKTETEKRRPAEWKLVIRSVLFTPEGGESNEILDHCTLNVHGFLDSRLDGLRDATVALKLGRLTVPFHDLEAIVDRMKKLRRDPENDKLLPKPPVIAINDVIEPLNDPASRDDKFIQSVSESKEFVSSILRGIHEIQLAVGFIGFSRRIKSLRTSTRPVYFNLAIKELGLDLMCLDSRSPAHRMYFSPNDVAHQALLTAISISAGVDDGHDHPERMLYVPMVTATVKTTLPSKTINFSEDNDAHERNSNILFANFVCTSPSVDLDPKHLPVLLAIAKAQETAPRKSTSPAFPGHQLVSRLLPKATIKLAVQEPVVRVSLPPLSPSWGSSVDYDLLISTTSTMTLDIEAQHSSDPALQYGLALNYRQTSSQLYYQTNSGLKHDLLLTDTVEVKVDVNTLPETQVFIQTKFQTFSVFLVRPEISEGIRQIVRALQKEQTSKSKAPKANKPNFLRQVPSWLHHMSIQGSDFNVELAGIDAQISKYSRGFALQLESWSAVYKAHRDDVVDIPPRRRSLSRSISRDRRERSTTPSTPPRKRPSNPTDGRRLAVHIEGLEGLVIDSVEDSTADPFIALPKFEVAFSTSTDAQGPLFHINSHAKSLQVQYSLYNHFSIGIAVLTIRRMFIVPGSHSTEEDDEQQTPSVAVSGAQTPPEDDPLIHEYTTLDFKATLVQIKAAMPADPPLMLQIFGLDAGRHRWATPFARAKLVRLYAGTPKMLSVWSRIVSVKHLRLDLREMRRQLKNKQTIEEKSIDIVTDAIRLGVPHGLVLHNIFDNIVNTLKTSEQLHHHFKTGSNDYILAKHPEKPKKVPRISLRSQVLLFEIEDSGFEWKLGTIYRAGLIEQQQRMARAEAFRLKSKQMESERQRRGSSRMRTSSAQPLSRTRSRSHSENLDKPRSKSTKPAVRDESPDGRRGHRGRMRYDTEGKCNMSGTSHRSIEKAYEKLQEFNAQSWKKRVDHALYNQNSVIKELRGLLWGLDDVPEEAEQNEPVMAMVQRPALMSATISDLGIVLDKPSFAYSDLPKFLNDVGKGMPLDMKYGLLIPMNLKISLGEARVSLRDYPLPLLHVPAIRPGQSPRLASLSVSTDFVIAEEFQGFESQRHINVTVVPPEKLGKDDPSKRFAIDVRRTISAVKTYSDMKIDINTSMPTRITWGTSYQPAIQDMMQVIENFTKPPMDPSERVGFWDKIRLSFHSRIDVNWKGDGDVHLNLKGSRDPYVVTGSGAGFVMVWRNNVRLRVAQDPDPRKFMTVDSGDYILAIPDFNHYAQHARDDDESDISGASSTSTSTPTAAFKKVAMKLSGNVQWLAGLMFERDVDNGKKRTFDFSPHYDVVLKHPEYAKDVGGEAYDAFRTFRSHHIHMSIAVSAPQDRDWNVSNLQPSKNYNSVHLTPRFFTHFFDWWSLFSGVMSLPVRQGKLWGSMEKSSKKFGRHLGTIKYNLLFSPLFISHMYKHKEAEDYQSDVVSATGLKVKLDSFMLDLHQRRETSEVAGHGEVRPKRTTGMKINQSQLDFISADFRALSATIHGTSSRDVDRADEDILASYQSPLATTQVDMSRFTIPDNDFTWIDMDDFVELDWILPAESNPETKILPLGFSPRFTYFRQTDHGDHVSGDTTRSSRFGDEATHYCVMSKRNDPRRVQADLIEARIHQIQEQIANNERAVSEQEVKVVRSITGDDVPSERLEALRNHTAVLQRKHSFLTEMLSILMRRLDQDDDVNGASLDTSEMPDSEQQDGTPPRERPTSDSIPLNDYTSDFNNRFVVHNPQIKWNNSLRDIIMRYIHQVSQRRGFVYYMSRRAVKFILDTLEEQKKFTPQPSQGEKETPQEPVTPLTPDREDDVTIQDRIDQLLHDGKQFVNADDPDRRESQTSAGEEEDKVSTEFEPQNTYHFRLIAPQIQLQSEKNPNSVVLVTAKGMQLKVVQIMDKDRVMDEVSGLVQRRFSAAMDSLQMFVTSTKTFSTEYLHMYSGNRYGAAAGECWPPWVPLEVMFEFQVNPYGFARVVHRTSASLRCDKFNTLRLKYNDDVSRSDSGKRRSTDDMEKRMDHIWIEFPHFRAICDSAQYFALYIIVLDLLLYSEPLEKTRSEKLEKIMLASDFSDLTGAPEMVEMLQSRIRQLEDIKMHFQINEKFLDRQGWKDRIAVDADLANCEEELFFMMKAITTSQQRVEDRNQESSTGVMRWLISSKEIAWHLVRGQDESLLEFQLKDGLFDRTDNNDGSNYNCVEIGRINGFNLLQNAIYPEIIAPYVDPARGLSKQSNTKMLRVQWLMLESIAGIGVVDYFEVDVMPLRVQLEREIAKRLFEYIFPGTGGNAFEGNGMSPFKVRGMVPPQDDNADSEDKRDNGEPASLPYTTSQDANNHQGVGTGAGELEHRLQPTMKLPDNARPVRGKKHGLAAPHSSTHWNPFHSDRSQTSLARKQNGSSPNLSSNTGSMISRSASSASLAPSTDTRSTVDGANGKRNGLQRSVSHTKRKESNGNKDKDGPSDDLTQMMNRASNYMTLAFFKIPSVVLCLSYKGSGKRNLEDVHDLVFRMPTIEYRNKTWSNLDLAMQIKKDLIKALISHAGAIVGNKLSHHRPSRQQAQSRLKEIANMSTILSLNGDVTQDPSEESSLMDDLSEDRPRTSFTSGRPRTSGTSYEVSIGESSISEQSVTPKVTGTVDSEGPVVRRTISRHSELVAEDRQHGNGDKDQSRGRSGSIGRHLTGLGHRLRPGHDGANHHHNNNNSSSNNSNNNNEDSDGDTKLKSRLLLGGQKLLRSLPGPKG